MEIQKYVEDIAKKAKNCTSVFARISSIQKNNLLEKMAQSLIAQSQKIMDANGVDVENAVQKGLNKTLIDRLTLDQKRINGMAEGLHTLIQLDDPIGKIDKMWRRPNGLEIGQQRVPLGVVGIIYEARPNVTVDAAGLCLKAGNAVILKGGSEALNSNRILV
ncbi:MAG TPA: gamma-glutamyl-phosphate reductase, partial [Firmicutes bacterium]|nr:gamma-glutamyl-phosphate reductase [Bacillota bacterium]